MANSLANLASERPPALDQRPTFGQRVALEAVQADACSGREWVGWWRTAVPEVDLAACVDQGWLEVRPVSLESQVASEGAEYRLTPEGAALLTPYPRVVPDNRGYGGAGAALARGEWRPPTV